MENDDLCARTSLAAQAQLCFAVLFFSVLFGRTRQDASILPHLVQDRDLCIRLSITIHYKMFPVFEEFICHNLSRPSFEEGKEVCQEERKEGRLYTNCVLTTVPSFTYIISLIIRTKEDKGYITI